MNEVLLSVDIEEDDSDEINFHVYCDGARVLMLNDEKLDKLGKEKKDIENKFDEEFDNNEKLKAVSNMYNGAVVSYAVATTLSLIGNIFQDVLFNAAWVGLFGVISGLKYRNDKKLRISTEKLDGIYEQLEKVEKVYDEEIERVAQNSINKEALNDAYAYA